MEQWGQMGDWEEGGRGERQLARRAVSQLAPNPDARSNLIGTACRLSEVVRRGGFAFSRLFKFGDFDPNSALFATLCAVS